MDICKTLCVGICQHQTGMMKIATQPGWDNVFDFVGYPFIDPIVCLDQCEETTTYTRLFVPFVTF